MNYIPFELIYMLDATIIFSYSIFILLRLPHWLSWDLGELVCQGNLGASRNCALRCTVALKRIRDASAARK